MSMTTLGKILFWVALVICIATIIALPSMILGTWIGSKAYTDKGRDIWLGRGIGAWLGLLALFLFLLSDKTPELEAVA